MKLKRILWGICSLIVVITLVSTVVSDRYKLKNLVVQATATATPTPNPLARAIEDNFPTLIYEPDAHRPGENRTNAKKYDRYGGISLDSLEDTVEATYLDWASGLPALPVEKSNLVLIGRLSSAQANLSENRNEVFSEFNISVEEILKGDSKSIVRNLSSLWVERLGGVVQLPTGVRIWSYVSGQAMPKVGGRYVFFLTHEFPMYGHQKDDIYLLTAYELRGGRVYPLDSPDGGNHPIATEYKGKDVNTLISSIKALLKSEARRRY